MKLLQLNAYHVLQDIHLEIMFALIARETVKKLIQMEYALLVMMGSV